jgi:hypothetical protein
VRDHGADDADVVLLDPVIGFHGAQRAVVPGAHDKGFHHYTHSHHQTTAPRGTPSAHSQHALLTIECVARIARRQRGERRQGHNGRWCCASSTHRHQGVVQGRGRCSHARACTSRAYRASCASRRSKVRGACQEILKSHYIVTLYGKYT